MPKGDGRGPAGTRNGCRSLNVASLTAVKRFAFPLALGLGAGCTPSVVQTAAPSAGVPGEAAASTSSVDDQSRVRPAAAAPETPPVVLLSDPAALAAFGERFEFGRLLFGAPAKDTMALRSHAAYRSLADQTKTDLELSPDPPAARFRRYWLASKDTRFVLVGIANRLDRRDVAPGTCGETRFIYRLAIERDGALRRLPLTYNVIFTQPDDGHGCREVAESWMRETPTALTEPGHPLHADRLAPANLLAVEFNVRVVEEAPNAMAANALGVLRYDAAETRFTAEPLEFEPQMWKGRLDRKNQRVKVLSPPIVDAALDGVGLLLDIDRASHIGLVPEGVPGFRGLDTWASQPFTTMVTGEHGRAINRPDDPDYSTPAALQHRLDGNSCSGCHRQRAIEGFHFPGAGGHHGLLSGISPHLSSQLQWRRSYVAAVAAGEAVELRRPMHNAGDGAAGDHCSLPGSPVASLACREGLQCSEAAGFSFGVCSEPGGGAPCQTESDDCAAPSRWFPGGFVRQSCTDDSACAPVVHPSDFRRCRGSDDRWTCAAARAKPMTVDRCDAHSGCRDGYVCVGTSGAGTCAPTAGLEEFRLYNR